MRNEFSAFIQQAETLCISFSPYMLGANEQGTTIEECRENLAEAICRILDKLWKDGLHEASENTIIETITFERSIAA